MIDLLNPVADHELNRGLISWWLPLENVSGGPTMWDVVGGNHGTLTGSPAWSVGPSEWGAVSFDNRASNQRVACGAPSYSPSSGFLVSCWFMPSDSSRSDLVTVWTDGRSAFGSQFDLLFGVSASKPALYLADPSVAVGGGVGSDTLAAGTWGWICGVWTGSLCRIYLNGVLQASQSVSPTFGDGSPGIWIGNNTGLDGDTLGVIGDVRLQQGVFEDSHVMQLYEESRRDYPNLLNRAQRRRRYTPALAAYTLSANAAAYTYTASSAGLYRGYKTAASAASYVYTGTAVTFPRVYIIQANAASYVYTATAATLARSRILGASAATYSYTAASASLLRGYKVSAAEATYTYTATAATLLRTRLLSAASASYTYTAEDATLQTSTGIALSADAASYTYTASSASLLRGYRVSASAASYTYTASSASLLRGRLVSASAASYTYTASDVTFSRTYILSAGSASYAYTGIAATLARSRRFSVDAAGYTYTASSASLYRGRLVVASAATYSYTGAAASLLRGRRLSASAAVYVLAGDEASLVYSGDPSGGFGNHISKIPLRG